jgi:gamma-glutamyltranspeptidase/glutathione hydrolase
VQVAIGLLDDGLDPQAALDRPRFCIEDGNAGGRVALEEGLPQATIERLVEMGHPAYTLGGYSRSTFGRGQVILRETDSGVLWAGSDPRADGCAMALA